ncbi:MAG TPA: exodeoxyribonuclease VII small subunit [Candidatus Pullichristensenella stercoripullorum]|nr:exodeoxyribonuclease VII small subunit [Candidatus Pullichristensenella stercoripullorum]
MNKFTFESGMDELETLVRDLENGALPLEESFQAFERGMALKKRLEKLLEEGDKRIRVLTENGEEPLEGEEE